MTFSVSIFASIFVIHFSWKWLPKWTILDYPGLPKIDTFRDPAFYIDFMLDLAHFWLPLTHLWVPVGSLLVPFGSLLPPFGSLLAPFWCSWAHFGSPLGSIFTFWGSPGSIFIYVCIFVWNRMQNLILWKCSLKSWLLIKQIAYSQRVSHAPKQETHNLLWPTLKGPEVTSLFGRRWDGPRHVFFFPLLGTRHAWSQRPRGRSSCLINR